MWTVRVRTADLTLTDPVMFSELVLMENYGTPDVLQLQGHAEELYVAMAPGNGCVVFDETGAQRFSGWLRSPEKRDDAGANMATLIFDGDLILLYDRKCWALPSLPWTEQGTGKDTVTGVAENRILSLIERNVGASAYHAGYGSTAAVSGASFATYQTLTPKDRSIMPQGFAQDPGTGDLYVAQADADNDSKTADDLTIGRYVGGNYKSGMYLEGGGHGDQLITSTTVKTGKTVFVKFRYRGLSGSHPNSGTWVRLPYSPGKKWRVKRKLKSKHPSKATLKANVTEALKYTTAPPKTTRPNRRGWWQGEKTYGGVFYRMYGTPYSNSGSTVSPAIPPFIEVISENAIVRTIDCSMLGRGTDGKPVGGRCEPQGLDVITIAGNPYLLVGFAINTKGSYQLRLYTYPLTAGGVLIDDRRIPNLRLPATQGRGPTGTTAVRFDNLGELVATLADHSSLRVRIVQTYEGVTPFLDVVVTTVPDLTAWARFGTPEDSGPAMLGSGWRYKSTAPTANVVLSEAGGETTSRKLTQSINSDSEAAWSRRIEGYLDQKGTDADDQIADNVMKALADGDETVEVSAPVSGEHLDLGTEVPVGARAQVVLDGAYVVDRIRRITTTLSVSDQTATKVVEPTFGSPDAGLSPSKKRIRDALRRLANVETSRTQ